jgi:hypothetical protein
VPPTVAMKMTMMTTTTIKSVITMKVYNLLNDVSFLLPMMAPLEVELPGSFSAAL